MIALVVFLIIIVIISIYILFAPFYLNINTINGSFIIKFHKIIFAQFIIIENSLILDLKILGWQKQINISNQKEQKEKSFKRPAKTREKSIPFRKVSAVIKSFKVNKFYLTINFGNMMLNGILYPIFSYFSISSMKRIDINFFNENELILEVENNFFRIIRAYVNS